MRLKSVHLLLVLTTLLMVSCSRNVTEPELSCTPKLVLQAPAGVLQDVAAVTVRVTGPDMDAVTGNLSISGNQATGTVRVPAGESRTFMVEAKDADGEVLAEGNTTRDLEAGSSPTVTVTLSIPSYDIVGYWGRSFEGGTEYFLLESDHTYEYEWYDDFGDLLYFDYGIYSTSDDQLTLTSDLGGDTWTYTYTLTDDGNTLTLSYEGTSFVFTRIS
jgi:hypothetical protein